jgi:hypothetical protein
MKVKTQPGFSLTVLRTHVLIMLFGLVPMCAQRANAQRLATEGTSNTSLPRVTAVNGPIEVGQTITVDVDHLSDWSSQP